MVMSPRKIVAAVGLTTGAYAITVVIRFGTSVTLARFLSPELFGILLIINTLRFGIELLTDVGIGQSVVVNKDGETREFLSTALIVQAARGFSLAIFAFGLSAWLGPAYGIDPLYVQISGGLLAIYGLQAMTQFLLQRRMRVPQMLAFELAMDVVAAVTVIVAAYFKPSVASIMTAYVVAAVIRSAATYLLPNAWNGLTFSKVYALEIIHFGKWIFLSSALMFACANFDRLYLGFHLPLAVFGVFGIARSISELPATLFSRIGHSLIFPLISMDKTSARYEIRARILGVRFRLLLLAAVGLGAGIVVSDFVVLTIYDKRYAEVGWMVPVLLCGVWITLLTVLSEYSLMGLGKPSYAVAGNLLKLAYLVGCLANLLDRISLLTVVALVAIADLPKYLTVVAGARREGMSFMKQDFVASIVFGASVVGFSAVRWWLGYGSLLDRLPGGGA